LLKYLQETGYQGWIMVEEESEEAEIEPDQVTIKNGLYLKDVLFPAALKSSQKWN
jgi:inosose dehydratase